MVQIHKTHTHTHLQCVFVVLGVQHRGHCGEGDAWFDLRGHQGAGQLGTEESRLLDLKTGHLFSEELEYFHDTFLSMIL